MDSGWRFKLNDIRGAEAVNFNDIVWPTVTSSHAYDRKVKKDAFYFYKANWSDESVLYITDRRFVERTHAITNIKIYSNTKKVGLLLNGKSLGKRRSDPDCVFVCKDVNLKPGKKPDHGQGGA